MYLAIHVPVNMLHVFKIISYFGLPVLRQTFLSHKYGYRPFPRTIPAQEFELITQDVTAEEKQLIETYVHGNLFLASAMHNMIGWITERKTNVGATISAEQAIFCQIE